MDIKTIDAEFVEARYQALQTLWGARNTRMDDYERLYLLELWKDEPDPDEVRITPPTAHETVERYRSLFLTRPPVISVPPSDVKGIERERADQLEKYLIGVWDMVEMALALSNAEWSASCLGEGVVRVVYDDAACEDEFPLLVQSVDPRYVFGNPGPRPLQDLEQVYACQKTRREIEEELAEDPRGFWAKDLGERPAEGKLLEDWLDEEVDYLEYWRLDVEEVEEKVEPVEPEEQMGVLTRLVAVARKMVSKVAPTIEGGVTSGEPSPPPSPILGEGESSLPPSSEGGGGKRMVRRRVVVRCVVADGKLLLEPVRMPGYCRLPFVRYPGIETGAQENEDRMLSVLFALSGGTKESGATGVLAAEAEMLALRYLLVRMFANGALITDDESLSIDWSPQAINKIAPGKTWKFLVPPGPHPAVDQELQILQKYIEDGSLPAMMKGRYVGDVSGIALSALTNPVMMQIASRQQVRERAYQEVNRLILSLTEKWAPAEGWCVHGQDVKGQVFEMRLAPDQIAGYRRNRVKLSASLPKDEAGEVMSMAQLVGQKLISRETFLDNYQQMKHLSSQSPQDELKRIVRDAMLFEGPMAQKLAEIVLADYSEDLAAVLQPQPPPQLGGGPAGPGGPGVPGGPPMPSPPEMGGGPMGGMPPQVVPPQAMPEAVGRMGPEGLMAMLQMQGNPQGPGSEEG